MNDSSSIPTTSQSIERNPGKLTSWKSAISSRVAREVLLRGALLRRHHPRSRTARAPGGDDLRYLRIAGPDEKLGPVPLVIGVTGHRDLHEAQLPILKERVARVFAEARGECRYTPLLLLTALAEGADQLAARVALEKGVPLAVVLPMPVEEYEHDFKTPEALAEFKELLGYAVVRHHAYGENDLAGPYSNAGAYIVANCDLLVALWDREDEKDRPGGTANVVRWQREGLPFEYTGTRGPLDPAGSGPVRHIHASRAGGPPAAIDEWLLEPEREDSEVPAGYRPSEPDPHGLIVQSPWLGEVDWPIREQLHGFNRDAVDLRDDLADVEFATLSKLKETYLESIPDSAARTMNVLARCDALASFFGRARGRAIKSTFMWAGAAITLFTTFAHPAHDWLIVLLGYLTCFAVALWTTHSAKDLQLEEKHLDYRALAEGLRVQFYWALAGLHEGVTEYYLRNQRTELSWIPRAIRALNVWWGPPGMEDAAASTESLAAVKTAWVNSEVGFFTPRIKRMKRLRGRYEHASSLLFKLALAGAAILFVVMLYQGRSLSALYGQHEGLAESLPVSFEWIITGLALLTIAAGFCRAIPEKMGYAAEIRRYEWMLGLHAQVEKAFGKATCSDPRQMRKMLVDLGRYALIENAEWLRIHREHPLEVPVGG